MVELHFVPLQNRSAVNKNRTFALRWHKKVSAVSETNGRLLPRHLCGRTFQAQVHVDRVVSRAPTDGNLIKNKLNTIIHIYYLIIIQYKTYFVSCLYKFLLKIKYFDSAHGWRREYNAYEQMVITIVHWNVTLNRSEYATNSFIGRMLPTRSWKDHCTDITIIVHIACAADKNTVTCLTQQFLFVRTVETVTRSLNKQK